MPNLRAQSLDANGLSLTASDGRTFVLTRADIVAHFQGEVGTRAVRLAATVLWAKTAMQAALGAEQLRLSDVGFDFDDLQGVRQFAFGTGTSALVPVVDAGG